MVRRDILDKVLVVKIGKELDPFWRSHYELMKAHYENTEFEFCEVCQRPFDRLTGGIGGGLVLCGPCHEDYWDTKRAMAAQRR